MLSGDRDFECCEFLYACRRESVIQVTFHGVRGSVPVSGSDFSAYGGHTTCFEIRTSDIQIIVDAGAAECGTRRNQPYHNSLHTFSSRTSRA